MKAKRKNALFSFHPSLVPAKLRRLDRLKRISWDRLSKDKRRKVALAAGISQKIADVWAQIRWRDIPEGWKDALITNLGAARNPMKKSKKKKKKATGKVARRPRTKRKQNTRARRRNKIVSFPFPVTSAQKTKLKRFLHRVTGRRVKFK